MSAIYLDKELGGLMGDEAKRRGISPSALCELIVGDFFFRLAEKKVKRALGQSLKASARAV